MKETVSASTSKLPKVLSGIVAATGLLVLLGWAFDIELLRRGLPNSVAMNPMTAAAFLLAALSLWLSQPNATQAPKAGNIRRGALGSAGLVALIGLARLLGYGAGWDAGIDKLLFASKLGLAEKGLPNRMAPTTALSFCFIGFALLFLDRKDRRIASLSQAMLVLVILAAFVAFLGHIYDAPGLYQPTPYIGMAAHTAACFMLIGLGILAARSDRGIAAAVASPHLGGVMARQLLPAAFLVPAMLGWLRIWGEGAGLYGARAGVGLMVIFSVILLMAVILKTAASLNQTDLERSLSGQRLTHALDLSGSAIISIDQEQRIAYFDERAERIFGYASRDILGRPLEDLLPGRFAPAHRRHVKDFAASPETARLMGQRREVLGLRKDGSEFPAEVAISKSNRNGALFTAVIRDVTERKRAEQEALRAERLVAANKELEAFSYSVSHDLRAPLRHIDGFIELLEKRASSALDEQSRTYLATISDSAKRMGTLIDDLLSFSRMAREEMRRERLSLGALAEEAVRDLKSEAGGRRITWKIAELPEAECDPSMMRLVFSNLLGNAVKFTRTRDEPVIEIGWMNDPGKIVIFVRDNGVGFDMQYAHKLFGVFQRLHRQEEFEGTGIGLANIRRIIHRHGGETWAESELGKGASFYFSLPAPEEMKT